MLFEEVREALVAELRSVGEDKTPLTAFANMADIMAEAMGVTLAS